MADVVNLVGIGYDRLTTNMRKSFDGMSPEKWIRIVIIVGTYMLLRPYLLKLGGRSQMKQHEKEAAEAEAEAEAEAKAKMSPNEFRGHKVDLPDDSDDDDEEDGGGGGGGQSSATEWGKKARKRQRTMVKKLIEAEEKRLQDLQEDDEDKDIQEFLTE